MSYPSTGVAILNSKTHLPSMPMLALVAYLLHSSQVELFLTMSHYDAVVATKAASFVLISLLILQLPYIAQVRGFLNHRLHHRDCEANALPHVHHFRLHALQGILQDLDLHAQRGHLIATTAGVMRCQRL